MAEILVDSGDRTLAFRVEIGTAASLADGRLGSEGEEGEGKEGGEVERGRISGDLVSVVSDQRRSVQKLELRRSFVAVLDAETATEEEGIEKVGSAAFGPAARSGSGGGSSRVRKKKRMKEEWKREGDGSGGRRPLVGGVRREE